MQYYPAKAFIRSIEKRRFLVPLKKEINITASAFDMYKSVRANSSFFLDSARQHPRTARYSFIGSNPFMIFNSGDCRANPIEKLRRIFKDAQSLKIQGFPPFTGGAVGYFSYDCCHLFERLPRRAKNDLRIPDIYLMFFDTIVAVDHFDNKVFIISNVYPGKPLDAAYDEAVEKIEKLEKKLLAVSHWPLAKDKEKFLPIPNPQSPIPEFHSTFTKEGFQAVVRRAKEYIAAGDIYQANLSQRFSSDISGIDPLALYDKLRQINPSPFACYLDMGDLKIASSSPERLLKSEDRWVQTRPIAGTRPRGKTPSEDLRLSCELILNEKERAEHIMLVDLERNDLGRVCDYGTVRVNELMVLEDYSHVIHIVSNVRGRLNRRKDRFDLIRAAFPGGTITGCPKIRCMEIIDELEPVTRNIYTGSIGYLDFNGDMDLNIAIRTFVIKDNKAYVQVGGGIVADSDPEREYYETLYKAEALFEALRQQRGIRVNAQLQPQDIPA